MISEEQLREIAIQDTASRLYSNFQLMKLELQLLLTELDFTTDEIQVIIDKGSSFEKVLFELNRKFNPLNYKELKLRFPAFMELLHDKIEKEGLDKVSLQFNISRNRLFELHRRYKAEMKGCIDE